MVGVASLSVALEEEVVSLSVGEEEDCCRSLSEMTLVLVLLDDPAEKDELAWRVGQRLADRGP